MAGGQVQCSCGNVVFVPEAGQFIPCPKCRLMVSLPAAPAPVQAQPVVSIPMAGVQPEVVPEEPTCPGCGAPISLGMDNCLACGFRLGGYARRDAASAQGGAGKFVLLALALAIVVAAMWGMIVAKNRPPAPAPKVDKGNPQSIPARSIWRAKTVTGLASVRQSIAAFQALEGRYPKDLDELAQHGLAAPAPPEAMVYVYDPKTGKVELVPTSSLETPPAE